MPPGAAIPTTRFAAIRQALEAAGVKLGLLVLTGEAFRGWAVRRLAL